MTEAPSTHLPRLVSRRRKLIDWISRHPKTCIALVLLGSCAILYIAIDLLAESRLRGCINAIRERGEPASLNDLAKIDIPIADASNMTVAIREAAKPLRTIQAPQDRSFAIPQLVATSTLPPPDSAISAKELANIHWYLNQNPQALDRLRAASRMKDAWFDWEWKKLYSNPGTPQIAEVGTGVLALMLDALAAIEEGDCPSATDRLVTAYRATHAYDCPIDSVLKCSLLIDLHPKLANLTVRWLNHCNPTAAEINAVREEVERMAHYSPPTSLLMSERVSMIELIQSPGLRTFLPPVPLGLNLDSAIALLPQTKRLDCAWTLEEFRDMIAESNVAEDAIPPLTQKWTSQMSAMPAYRTLSRGMPLGLFIENRHGVLASQRALLALLAAREFNLEKGEWPTTIEELSPAYLSSIPKDPFNGKYIQFSVTAYGAKAWSVGANLIDDHGKFVWAQDLFSMTYSPDIGWEITNPNP